MKNHQSLMRFVKCSPLLNSQKLNQKAKIISEQYGNLAIYTAAQRFVSTAVSYQKHKYEYISKYLMCYFIRFLSKLIFVKIVFGFNEIQFIITFYSHPFSLDVQIIAKVY